MKFIRRQAGNWTYEHQHRSYTFSKEDLVRDGGSGKWYVVFDDPKEGACIDDRVPEGVYDTLREAKAALLAHCPEVPRCKGGYHVFTLGASKCSICAWGPLRRGG